MIYIMPGADRGDISPPTGLDTSIILRISFFYPDQLFNINYFSHFAILLFVYSSKTTN